MSQFFIKTTSGNLPPNVPTTFQAQTGGVNDGTATPNLNIINFDGEGGIQVTASGNTVTITDLEGTLVGTATTSDILGQTAFLNTLIPVPANEAISGRINIVGYDSGNVACIGGEILFTAYNTGVIAIFAGLPDTTINKTANINNARFTATLLTTNVRIFVQGVAGFTINWKGIYDIVSLP